MKAAIISLGSKSSKWVYEEMKKHFDEVDKIQLKKIQIELGKEFRITYKGEDLKKYDCIYAKGSFRYAQLLKTLTTLIPEDTFLAINPNAYIIGHDKLLTQVELEKAKVPMPATYVPSTVEHAKEMLKKLNYPIVMKFPHGTQGKGVMFADSYSSALSVLDALTSLNQPFIIQEYVETGSTDLRIIVVGDEVVAAMRRVSEGEDRRANIHAGGHGEPVELDEETKNIAIKAAKAVGIGICGVDILQSGGKSYVIEVNVSPGLQGITAATNINIAEKIAKWLYHETVKFKEKINKTEAKKVMSQTGLIEKDGFKQIVSTLDIRGNRIILPDIVGKISKFNDSSEVLIEANKNEIRVKKL